MADGTTASERVDLGWTFGKIVLATLLVVALLGLFWLLYRSLAILFAFFVALVISAAIRPMVDALRKHGISPAVGAAAVLLILGVMFLVAILLALPIVVDRAITLSETLTNSYLQIRQQAFDSPSRLISRLALNLPPGLAQIEALVPALSGEGTLEGGGRLLASIGKLGRSLILLAGVLLMSFTWMVERESVLRALFGILPQNKSETIRTFIELAEARLGAYVRGLVLLSFVVGALSFVVYLIMDLPNPFLLALIAGIMEAVPIIGPALGALPAAMIAYTEPEVSLLWIFAATLGIQALENAVLVPKVMKRAAGVHPVVSLLAVAAFGSLFGFVGALIAIPLAAVIQLATDQLLLKAPDFDHDELQGRGELSRLQYEAWELRIDLRHQAREYSEVSSEEILAFEQEIEMLADRMVFLLNQRARENQA